MMLDSLTFICLSVSASLRDVIAISMNNKIVASRVHVVSFCIVLCTCAS